MPEYPSKTLNGPINGYYYWTYDTFDYNNTKNETIRLSTGEKADGQNTNNSSLIRTVTTEPKASATTDSTQIIPNNTNAIFFFSGYPNNDPKKGKGVTECLDSNTNGYNNTVADPNGNTGSINLYLNAFKYFDQNGYSNSIAGKKPYLIGLTLGGGGTLWNTDIINDLKKDMDNDVIKYGDCKDFETVTNTYKNGVNNKSNIVGNFFNSLVFDLEGTTSYDNTTIDALVDFVTWIKRENNKNWTIIVTYAHTSTFYQSEGFMSTLHHCEYIDYFSPQLYTDDYTFCNEYTRTFPNSDKNPNVYDYTWSDFYVDLKINPNYGKYGTNIILPSLGLNNSKFIIMDSVVDSNTNPNGYSFNKANPYSGLLYDAGSNEGCIPYIEVNNSIISVDNSGNPRYTTFPNPNASTFHIDFPKSEDKGAADFFTRMFNDNTSLTETIGGSIQFGNNTAFVTNDVSSYYKEFYKKTCKQKSPKIDLIKNGLLVVFAAIISKGLLSKIQNKKRS